MFIITSATYIAGFILISSAISAFITQFICSRKYIKPSRKVVLFFIVEVLVAISILSLIVILAVIFFLPSGRWC